MSDNLFTSFEYETLDALARYMGFQSLRDYLMALVQQDAKQYGVEVELDESLRRGWAEAMSESAINYDEFERLILSDDE
jgi:hypothetical protein